MFRCYGLPWRMLMDNGSPWGSDAQRQSTLLTAWLTSMLAYLSRARLVRIGRAFIGEHVALRHTTTDGLFDVYYCHHSVRQVNLTTVDSEPE